MGIYSNEACNTCFELGQKAAANDILDYTNDPNFSDFVFRDENIDDYRALCDAWYLGNKFPKPNWNYDMFEKGRVAKDEKEYRKAWGYDKDEYKHYQSLYGCGNVSRDGGNPDVEWTIAIFGFCAFGFLGYILVQILSSLFS